jgi:putative transposase
VYNLNYHIVWCVKYRRKVLDPEIAQSLVDDIFRIGEEKGFTVIEAKVGDGDHIHVFVSVPPKYSITTIISWLKGITARHLFMRYPGIRERLWRGHLWNDSYFVESIGSTSEENVLRYIERQTNHQK